MGRIRSTVPSAKEVIHMTDQATTEKEVKGVDNGMEIMIKKESKNEAEAMLNLLKTMSPEGREHLANYIEAIRLGYSMGKRSA